MNNLNDLFIITVNNNHMIAELNFTETLEEVINDISLTESQLLEFLKERRIVYGIYNENIKKLTGSNLSLGLFPLIIAEGKEPVNGEAGRLEYAVELSTEIDRSERWDFREVMRIPTVQEGEKLVTKIPPTKGIDGKNVYGRTVRAKPGKPVLMNPGKNVEFREKDQSFYSTAVGQIQVGNRFIHIQTVYELRESVSMKSGNIDFAGSVIIRGDVPTGFTVKADGDITIYGLVEAATIIAGGSVTISEGLAGLKTGSIKAGENVKISYINQGKVTAGDSIFVENSILHSECIAQNNIFCQRGNIIGGTLSVGQSIEAKDVGNRMNTTTELSFGVDQRVSQNIQHLIDKKDTLTDNLQKLNVLRERLNRAENLDSQGRVTLLRLESSYKKTTEQINQIDAQLAEVDADLGDIETTSLKVRGTLYPNVIVAFGKYKRRIDKNYDFVQVRMLENEIKVNTV